MMSSHGGDKRKFALGLAMMILFTVVLVAIFSPLLPGKNGQKQNTLDYLDNLYNSISKGSAYYIPELQEAGRQLAGQSVDVTIKLADPAEARRAALLFEAAGARVAMTGSDLELSGDLGAIMASCLRDAEAMFHNQGGELGKRYQGEDARTMLHAWWLSLKALDKGLNRQKAFAHAKFVQTVIKKAVELSYNYYTIEPQKIGDKWRIVVFSLLFYVIYTLWYGFGIMYMFEGAGYKLGGH